MEGMGLIQMNMENGNLKMGKMFHVIIRYLEKGLFLESKIEPNEVDKLFWLLSSFRRWFTVLYLDENEIVTLKHLAEACASKETGDDLQKVREEYKKAVYIDLYQTHLPELADAGIVGWDKTTGEVWPEDTESALFLLDEPRVGIWLRWRLWRARRALCRYLPP